jgi:hypothetical protein
MERIGSPHKDNYTNRGNAMMKVLLLAALIASPAMAGEYVRGHTRSDGTYVQGHYRTSPNSTKLDNYSTQGNYNPYTGRSGTVDPYKPSHNNPYGSPYNKKRSDYGD